LTTAALYLRVSTRHQADEGFSLEEQQRVLTDLAARRGWEFRLYIDPGRSGEGIEHRPEMLRLLADAEAGHIDVVAVVDDSRLARDEFTAAFIRHRLRQAGVTLATPTGDRDLSDPTDSFLTGMLGLNAAFEQGTRTKKMRDGLRATVRAGFWPGGPAPYGYTLAPDPAGSKHRVLAINPAEAQLLQDAAGMILDHGHSTWTATRTLNAAGRLTRSGTPWYYRNLAFQLKKPHLTGTYTYNSKTGPVSMEIPAILEQGRWDALQAILRAPQAPERQTKFYALSGFLRCACGGSLSGVWRKERGQRFYQCSRTASSYAPEDRCPHRPRYLPAAALEATLWTEIHALLTSPDRLRQAAQAHIDTSLADAPIRSTQRATISHRLDQFDLEETGVIRTHARDQITDSQLAATLDKVRDERVTLQGHLAQLDAWDTERRASRARLSQLDHLAHQATRNLANATPEQQRRVYQLLDLHIRVTPDCTYEISGTIPIHGPLSASDPGQLSTEAPQHPLTSLSSLMCH